MYRKKDFLNQLVDSLSLSEKRYFTLYTQAFNPGERSANYLKLFQEIMRGKCASSDHIPALTRMQGTNARRRLYENILKSLQLYHRNKFENTVLHNLVSQIEILYHLNLPEHCQHLLNKAYKVAVATENHIMILNLLEWEKKINLIIKNPPRTILSIVKEEQKVLEVLMHIRHLESIYSSIMEIKKQFGYVGGMARKQLDRIVLGPAMPPLESCTTYRARYYFHSIYALYYTMTYDHKKAYDESKKILSIPKNKLLSQDFMDGLLYHATSCMCIGNFEECLDVIDDCARYLKLLKLDLSDFFTVKLFYYSCCCRLIVYNYMGAREKLTETVAMTESGLVAHREKIPVEMLYIITGNLRNGYIGLTMPEKAEKMSPIFYSKEMKQIRRMLYDDYYLFRLIVIIQRGDYSILQSVALSSWRYYKKEKKQMPDQSPEVKITALFNRSYGYHDKSDIHSLLIESKNILLDYIEQLKGGAHFQEMYTFYIIWIDSLLSGRPFYEEAAEWYKHFRADR